jgi:hypothetical protein
MDSQVEQMTKFCFGPVKLDCQVSIPAGVYQSCQYNAENFRPETSTKRNVFCQLYKKASFSVTGKNLRSEGKKNPSWSYFTVKTK